MTKAPNKTTGQPSSRQTQGYNKISPFLHKVSNCHRIVQKATEAQQNTMVFGMECMDIQMVFRK